MKGTWKVLWEANEYGSTADYVRQWLDLLGMGLLPQLKRCGYRNCRKWYFAKFSHTSFHSVKCRNAEKEADPIRHEKRQDYERRYYRDVLSKYGKQRKKL